MQDWTVIYELSAIPTLFILLRTSRLKSTEATTSRQYYSASLILVLIWVLLDFTTANLPLDQTFLAGLEIRLAFLIVSITVFLFVMSSIYFTRVPRNVEMLGLASPIIIVLIAFVVDPFTQTHSALGWYGDFAYPIVRFSWLGLILLVMVYSFFQLFRIRAMIKDTDVKRRMTYFTSGFVVALLVGVFLYLLPQAASLPDLSSIGVNLSLLLAYPAFSPVKRKCAV